MKILALPAFFYPHIGGAEKSAIDFAKACQSAGENVVLVTRLEEDSLPFEVLDRMPVYRIRYPILRFHQKNFINAAYIFIQSFLRLLVIIFKFKPDIIYVHMLSENGVMAGLLTYLYHPRIIVSFRGHDIILYKNNNVIRAVFQRLLDRSEKITFPSEALVRRVKDTTKYYLNTEKIRVIPNSINLEDFDKNTNTFVLPAERSYVFGCGHLLFDKGFDILVKAFALLSSTHPEIDLIIAGEGEERSNLGSLAATLNIFHRVHLIGLISPQALIPYYRGCIFFVLPSRFEAFGNVILEAMAASKAVISSDSGGGSEVIKDGFNGYLFESENHQALAEKMKLLSENKTMLDLLGGNARAHLEKYYCKDIINNKIVGLIRS